MTKPKKRPKKRQIGNSRTAASARGWAESDRRQREEERHPHPVEVRRIEGG